MQFTGLTKGTTYTFKVVAENAFGSATVFSTVSIICADVPAAVPSVVISQNITQVLINFTAPTDNGGSSIDHYIISLFNPVT